MSNLEEQHEIVKESLIKFVSSHIPEADFSVVDEIVLSYIISILEEVSNDPCFDVEGFIEMMGAYFTEFSQIDAGVVCNWIFKLESELTKPNTSKSEATLVPTNISFQSLSLLDVLPESKLKAQSSTTAEKDDNKTTRSKKRNQLHSETSDSGSTDSTNCDYFFEESDILQEMFPDTSYLEVKHCIAIAKGDLESATQILLHRQESGQSLSDKPSSVQGPKNAVIDDAELKNRIIARYSYIEKNAESREYKPVVPKVEPKKMVRYRDNKIVSLKGERYTEIQRDDQEAQLKKPKKPVNP